MLKALKTYQILDFYLAGVKKEYRNKGVDILMVYEITKTAMQFGFSYSESNPELETNKKIQNEWKLLRLASIKGEESIGGKFNRSRGNSFSCPFFSINSLRAIAL